MHAMEVLRYAVSTLFKHSRNIEYQKISKLCLLKGSSNRLAASCSIHTSTVHCGLDEFFDEDNYDSNSIKVGRPWRKNELRIKSNQDLHKLWYVLLKERNMLMTMEHMFTKMLEPVQNPERIHKVEESMENILTVIKERNNAYSLLEFGKTVHPKKVIARNVVGLPYERTLKEHYIPKHLNERHRKMHPKNQPWMRRYLALYEEKYRKQRNYQNRKYRENRKEMIQEFELDEEEVPETIDHTGDKLEEFIKQTEELNDVGRDGR